MHLRLRLRPRRHITPKLTTLAPTTTTTTMVSRQYQDQN